MIEQKTDYFHVCNTTDFFDMKRSIDDNIKIGWFVKFIYHSYNDYTLVIYERKARQEPSIQ